MNIEQSSTPTSGPSEVTQLPRAFLHWLRDGGLFAVTTFPAGTPTVQIATWRQRVAENGGAAIEVYDPTPPPSAERMAYLRQQMAAARAARG